MVQDFVFAAYRWLLSAAHVIEHLLPWIVIAAVAAVALWIVLRRLDPETAQQWKAKLSNSRGRYRQVGLLSLTVLVLCGALVQARKVVAFRQMTVEEAPASRRNVPHLGGIVQYAPRVGVVEERTYTRTLTLPPSYVERIGTEGLQILSPYLSDPSSENVTKLVDSFKRSGTDVIFTRQLTRLDEAPISADSADVKVSFNHHGSASGHRFYDAIFDAQYRFRNPRPDAAVMRLTFPLPQGGGTVQGFNISSGSTKVTEPDEHGEYAWSDTIPSGQEVVVDAHYTVTGSHEYYYSLGSEQRRIGNFHLAALSSQAPRYVKSGIYPTSISNNSSDWQLKDVITAQSIIMQFPSLDLDSQLLDKTLTFFPLILFLFGLGAWLLIPARSVVGTLAFGIGLLGTAVLSAYASPTLATIAGTGIAVVLGGIALCNSRGWLLSIAAGLLCVAFLTSEHGGLLAWVICLFAVVAFLSGKFRIQQTATT